MKPTSSGHRESKPPCHPRRGLGYLRITGGVHCSRRLLVPDRPGLRPAQDRVRAAIFSALGERVPHARVLDLFAGTGAYGMEALSRGAASATFVEQDSRTAEGLRQNLLALKYDSPVMATPVECWIPRSDPASFDLIFLDPPYDQTGSELSRWGTVTGMEKLLAPQGRIIWEHSRQSRWSSASPLTEVWHREYGRAAVTFLAWPPLD